MYALNWSRASNIDDGLEPLAPLPAQVAAPGGEKMGETARQTLAPAYAAAGGALAAALILLTGPFAPALTMALGGAAALAYLGTALIAARAGAAALDLGAAAGAAATAMLALGPAVSALLVHAVWGILRSSGPAIAPGRCFAMSWAAFHATAALLLAVGT
jgi:hypothetical protein